jgi:hypothetical protein
MGITEVEPDIWYVGVRNISLETVSVQKDSWSIFKIDMRLHSNTGSAMVTNVTAILGSVF